MPKHTKSMAALLLVLLCALAGGHSATAATKATKKKVATTKKKVTTTTKKGSSTTTPATTTKVASVSAATTLAASTTAAAPAATSATTTAAPPVPVAGGITVQNFSFTNSPISAKVGVAVVITNLDTSEHTVTADDGTFSEAIGGNKTASFTVSKAGTFTFHCNFHPTMKGTITVS